MPVSTTENKKGPYACNGSIVDFSFPYKILGENDLIVTLTSPAGVDTVLTIGSDYSVAMAGVSWDNGAIVTTVETYASGYSITIVREIPLLQTTDYLENDAFPAEVHENDHDKIMMIAQQIKNELAAHLRFPSSDPAGVSNILPAKAARASQFAAFNAEGEVIGAVGSNPAGVPVTPAAATLLDDTSIGDILTTLGFSTWFKSRIADADASAHLTALGVSAFIKTLIDDADGRTARRTLGMVPILIGNWTEMASPTTKIYRAVCWDPTIGLFCAVGEAGALMTSLDGNIWTDKTPAASSRWTCVCAKGGLLVALCDDSGTNRAMWSTDGSSWYSAYGTPSVTSAWTGVCWASSLSLFCAVAQSGTNRVSLSTDGDNWTDYAGQAKAWYGVCWSPDLGMFVAVSAGASDAIMTSTNGTTWTLRSAPVSRNWKSVCWSHALGMFCAVANSVSSSPIITSPNGIDWTSRSLPSGTTSFDVVEWSEEFGAFVASTSGGYSTYMSYDGIDWIELPGKKNSVTSGLAWCPKHMIFVGVGYGTGKQAQRTMYGG